jgi:hypothetical protein
MVWDGTTSCSAQDLNFSSIENHAEHPPEREGRTRLPVLLNPRQLFEFFTLAPIPQSACGLERPFSKACYVMPFVMPKVTYP